jgi:hypothetical protein
MLLSVRRNLDAPPVFPAFAPRHGVGLVQAFCAKMGCRLSVYPDRVS